MTPPLVKPLNRQCIRQRCSSDMLDPETRKHGHLVCKALATYTVDDKPMCKRHAGSFLVNLFAAAATAND